MAENFTLLYGGLRHFDLIRIMEDMNGSRTTDIQALEIKQFIFLAWRMQ